MSSPQQQIDDTVNVMKKNLESVAQRGEHIDQLQDKSENLNQSAQGFRRGANRVRKQMWWKNVKMRIWIIVGIIVLLLIIVVPGMLFPIAQIPVAYRLTFGSSCCDEGGSPLENEHMIGAGVIGRQWLSGKSVEKKTNITE